MTSLYHLDECKVPMCKNRRVGNDKNIFEIPALSSCIIQQILSKRDMIFVTCIHTLLKNERWTDKMSIQNTRHIRETIREEALQEIP